LSFGVQLSPIFGKVSAYERQGIRQLVLDVTEDCPGLRLGTHVGKGLVVDKADQGKSDDESGCPLDALVILEVAAHGPAQPATVVGHEPDFRRLRVDLDVARHLERGPAGTENRPEELSHYRRIVGQRVARHVE
jgi:hypothetical protein